MVFDPISAPREQNSHLGMIEVDEPQIIPKIEAVDKSVERSILDKVKEVEKLPENERVREEDIAPKIMDEIKNNEPAVDGKITVLDKADEDKLSFSQAYSEFFKEIKRKFYAYNDSQMTSDNFGNLYCYLLEEKKLH